MGNKGSIQGKNILNGMNTFIVPVPQQYAYVVERLGKYTKTLNPGLNFVIPFIERVTYRHSLKEQSFEINAQQAITMDNVFLFIDGVVYIKIEDPYKCSYGAKDPLIYTYMLSQSIMRNEIGKLSLDKTFEERDMINQKILTQLSEATLEWGIKCIRYEIKDIKMSESMLKILNLQAESERKKRAEILLSEGQKQSDINLAQSIKQKQVLQAEAIAQSIQLKGQATVNRINLINNSVIEKQGQEAMKFKLAEQYMESLKGLAEENKNLIIKANLNEPSQMVKDSKTILNKLKIQLNESI